MQDMDDERYTDLDEESKECAQVIELTMIV